jgi:hypothetical protein
MMKKLMVVVTLLLVGLNSQPVAAGVCKYPPIADGDLAKAEMAFSGKVVSSGRGSRHTTKQRIKVIGDIKNSEKGDFVTVYLKQDFNSTVKQSTKPFFAILNKKELINGHNEPVYVAPLCDGTVHFPVVSKNAQAIKKFISSVK